MVRSGLVVVVGDRVRLHLDRFGGPATGIVDEDGVAAHLDLHALLMGLEARLVTDATGNPAILVNAQLHLRLGLLLLAAGLALTLAAARATAFAFALTTFALLVFFCEPDLIMIFLLGHSQLFKLIGLGIVRRVIRALVLFVLRIGEDLRLAPVAIRRDQHHVLAFLVE